MNESVSPGLKIILSILLLISLADMPGDYMDYMRWLALFLFLYIGLRAIFLKTYWWAALWGAMMLLYQPFWVPALPEPLWRLISLVVAIVLAGSAILEAIQDLNRGKRRGLHPQSARPSNLEAIKAKRKKSR
jgi:hypothetical protein